MARSSAKRWDYIIVGGGTAGCVLANRLSEDPTVQVLVLEAGRSGMTNPYVHFPAAFYKIGPKYNWLYEAEPDPSINDQVIRWPAGRLLGGSSAINAMAWTRGHRADFDAWAAGGCAGWDYASVLPYYRRGESFGGGADEFRGGDGPQRVNYPSLKHPLTEVFIQAAEQSGIPYRRDLNGATQEGVSLQQVSQRRGFRDSAATSYLAQARRRPNVKVVTDARARRIVIQNGQAVGVEYASGSSVTTAYADGEVILSSGSIASPKLLMLSGVGPAEHLRQQGIDVLLDLPGVGGNLQEHVVADFTFEATVPTLNTELNLRGFVKHGLDFVLRGAGGATTTGSTAVSFFRLHEDSDRPDVEVTFRPLAVVKSDESAEKSAGHRGGFADMKPMKGAAMQSSVWLCHPRSRGTVRLRSGSPEAPPRIRHQLLGDADDLEDLIAGCRALRGIFDQESLRPFVRSEVSPGASVDSDQDFEAFLRASARHGAHPVGTCAMGDDAAAVVDPQLRVRGIDRLRVVDASVMPSLTTGHTNAPTVMIAERASDLIRSAR